MKKTLSIFSHKNYIGIITDTENGEFLNDIKSPSQLGCIVEIKNVEITEKAKNLLKAKGKRCFDSISPLMLIASEPATVGVMGFGKTFLDIEDEIFSRDCDVSLLDQINLMDEADVPRDFKEHIDSII